MSTEVKETNILKRVAMAVSKAGARVFRNNTGKAWQGRRVFNGLHKGGALFLKPGRYIILADPRIISFGLCEGSSDNIGWVSVKITQEMIGKKIAVFLALEAKTEEGIVTAPQQNFINVVNNAGGIAGVVRNDQDALDLILNGCEYSN